MSHSPLRLPEESIGLGYQNLISMVFRLMRFRDAWMRVGKGSHTEGSYGGPWMNIFHRPFIWSWSRNPKPTFTRRFQQVFIRHAYDVLRNHPDLKASPLLTTQLVVSTHSSHIAHESRFSSLRYFRRRTCGSTLMQFPHRPSLTSPQCSVQTMTLDGLLQDIFKLLIVTSFLRMPSFSLRVRRSES